MDINGNQSGLATPQRHSSNTVVFGQSNQLRIGNEVVTIGEVLTICTVHILHIIELFVYLIFYVGLVNLWIIHLDMKLYQVVEFVFRQRTCSLRGMKLGLFCK